MRLQSALRGETECTPCLRQGPTTHAIEGSPEPFLNDQQHSKDDAQSASPAAPARPGARSPTPSRENDINKTPTDLIDPWVTHRVHLQQRLLAQVRVAPQLCQEGAGPGAVAEHHHAAVDACGVGIRTSHTWLEVSRSSRHDRHTCAAHMRCSCFLSCLSAADEGTPRQTGQGASAGSLGTHSMSAVWQNQGGRGLVDIKGYLPSRSPASMRSRWPHTTRSYPSYR